jgi:autotransporter-associated beta strand protein
LQVVQHLTLQSIQTFATLDLDGTITRTANTSALTITGTSDIGGSITTSGTQDYEGAITLTGNTTLVSGDQITFDTTVNSETDETNNLTVTASELQVDGIIGGTQTLGAISITGILDLNAAITNATSLSVSSTSDLGADVTTSSTQTYSDAVTLSANVILTTTSNGSVYFGSTVDGGYDLDITTNGTGDVTFVGAVGGITPLGDITISTNEFTATSITAGNLDITHTGAGSITGIITDAAEDNTLALVKAGSATLTLSANNTFTGNTTISSGDLAVGGSGKLGGGSYNGAIAIASGSTLSYSSSSSQTFSGSISGDGDIEKITSASSTLTISGANSYTGGTVVSAGIIKAGNTHSQGPPETDAFGTGSLTIATGAVLDLNGQTINNTTTISGTGISSTGAITNSNATAATIKGNITLAADSSIGGSNNVTLSGVISGAYNLTKVGSSTYTLSGTNTFTGDLTISAGTVTVSGTLHDDVDVINSGTYDVDSTDTINSLRGSGAVELNTGITLTTGDAGSDEISGIISGAGNLTKVGAGILTLTGNNSFSGTLTVSVGSITLNDADGETGTVLSDSLTVIVNGGSITVSDTSETVGTVTQSSGTITGTLISSSGYAFAPASGVTLTISEILSGSGNLTMSGDGTLVLEADNTYTGDTTISAGTIKLTGSVNSLTDLIIASGATLDLQATQTFATLDLDGTISNSTGSSELTITGTSDIGGSITTSGTQTYTGAVTLSTDVTLTTTDSNITFSSTVDGDGTARDLTIDMDNGVGADGTVQFANTVGANDDLDVIDITGNLNLDAAISNTTSLSVSGTSNLGANVTTSSTQTYTGDVTISADISLNTSGGDVTFDGDINTNTTSSSESGILQFLGGGSYKYSTDSGSTYSTGTATSSATTLGTGSLTFSSGSYTWTTPDGASATKLLVVGGGGGGGSSRNTGDNNGAAGGGGAGGLIYDANYSISANTSYTITVGAGGVGGAGDTSLGANGTQGGNSVFNDQTAIGGGYGAIGNDSGAIGGTGGSGGGGGNDGSGSNGGSETSGQGNPGGSVTGNYGDVGAGGGGAGGAGHSVNTGSTTSGGDGGAGLSYDITGSSQYYAGGGGGGANYAGNVDGYGGTGGSGVGGNGGDNGGSDSSYGGGDSSNGSDGIVNTGSGGGGGSDDGSAGGAGASGIVVVNYSYSGSSNAEHNLTINSGSGATDINGAVANIGTLSITSTSTSSEASGIISTDTNLTKAGSGTLTLSGTNTYSGSTTITNGVISISSSANLGATPGSADADNIIFNGGTLTTTATFTLGTNKGITLTGNGTINTDTSTTLTYGGIITGSADLTKSGSGTLILSGANGHTGDLNITAGTATITGTLHNSTDVTVSSGAVYDVDQTDTINSLSGAGDIEIASSKTLTTGDSGSDTISGVISGAGNLTKAGSGTLTLSGTNTYSGSTTITNGVISISSSANLGATPGSADADNIIFNGGTLTTTATFTLGTNKGITLTGNGTINTDTSTTLTYGGIITGSADLTKSGSGTLILSGANGHTGDLNITAGTATITGTLHNSTDVTVSSGAVYDVDQTDTINSLSGAGDIEIASSKTLTTGDSGSDTISGVISGAGNLTKAGSGTLTLSGTNTYSGSTTITNGVISISSSANLGATPGSADADNIIFNGGTLTTTATFTLGTNKGITLTGNGTINTDTSTTLTYGGIITGSADLTKSGSGTLILSGANGHTGDLNITAGTATITGTLHNSTDVTVSSGAVYDVDQTDTINSLSGAGDIEIASSKTLTTGDSGSDTISGVISGAGNLTKAGSGTLTLSGTNTYSGSTTITNGVISISSSANLGATPGSADADNIIFNGGTLTTTATFTLGTNKGITMTGTGTINTGTSKGLGYGGIIDGSGTLTKDGLGSITLTGVSTFDGDLNIDAGTVVLDTGQIYATGTWGSHGIVTINSGGSLHLHQFTGGGRNLGNLSFHANLLVIDGGTLQFIGDSDLDGTMGDAASNGADNKLAFTIGENGGTLANNTDYTWSIWEDTDTATYNPVYNGNLTIHGSGDFSFNAVVSGSINLTKTGSGTLLLSANNTYTGQTNINAGIISITDNNSLGSADGATIVADGASLSISNDITSPENITINGTGISSNGAIRNTADDNTLTGLITLGANSEIQIDTGSSLTLNPTSGSAVTGTYNLTIESVGTSHRSVIQ